MKLVLKQKKAPLSSLLFWCIVFCLSQPPHCAVKYPHRWSTTWQRIAMIYEIRSCVIPLFHDRRPPLTSCLYLCSHVISGFDPDDVTQSYRIRLLLNPSVSLRNNIWCCHPFTQSRRFSFVVPQWRNELRNASCNQSVPSRGLLLS